MAELNEDYITDLRKGIVEAIFKVSAARQAEGASGSPNSVYIGSAEVCQTLTILLAEFLEGKPDLVTPGDIRQMSETIAKKLRLGIAEIRQLRAQTGHAPLPSIIINSN